MDLLQQAQTLAGSQYAPLFTAAVTLLSLAPKLFAPLLSAFEAHDKHFVRKPLERLKALRSSASKHSGLAEYLETSIELEAFRIASGITASRAKMEFLLALNKDGTWSKPQLRRVAQHVGFPEGSEEPAIISSTSEKIFAVWSAVFAGVIALMGAVFFIVLASTNELLPFLFGAIVFAGFVAFARFILNEYISYKLATRAQADLKRRTAAS
ncbi:hypothetical protein [Stutzerimonas nitrititolerans]|uniref:hypothetical protein n=1 Tax=Stutzerimonas nitrititolerans TaxID=2482751 RepID=UPI00289D63BD|nr:hypothetical protein [Stutzerimonas nitrititolerans]